MTNLVKITGPYEALEEILRLCNHASRYTRRTQTIHEVAMRGLGLTANQRHARHITILSRVGDNPDDREYQERRAKRLAAQEATYQRQLAGEAVERGEPVPEAGAPFEDWMDQERAA